MKFLVDIQTITLVHGNEAGTIQTLDTQDRFV